jgi:hypothetical protein
MTYPTDPPSPRPPRRDELPSPRAQARRTAAALAALVALAGLGPAPPAAAQEPLFRTVARTGLHGLHAGHSIHLNLVDVGTDDPAPTQVRLRLLGEDGRVLRRLDGELRPGQSLRLSLARRGGGPSTAPLLVRAEATLTTPESNLAATRPILTLELVNDKTLDTVPAATCPLAFDPRGQGPILNCDCDLVGSFTS